jgi:putative restriction endonuclease
VRQSFLPLSLTWDAFETKNGAPDIENFSNSIYRHRQTNRKSEPDPTIGALILAEPFFLDESNWIPIPQNWSPGIQQGKTYSTGTEEGQRLYKSILDHLSANDSVYVKENGARYGNPQLYAPRLGQGGFRIMVTEAYHRRCAITGEKTLPVLQASHIRPYAYEGPHKISNGMLLREDIHTLFDRGFITINENKTIEVSKRIKEEYGNGKDYYAYHGKRLVNVPDISGEQPSGDYLLWHNEHIYNG